MACNIGTLMEGSTPTTSAFDNINAQAKNRLFIVPFASLPHNILELIFWNLPPADRVHLCLTCRRVFSILVSQLYANIVYAPDTNKGDGNNTVAAGLGNFTVINRGDVSQFFSALNLKNATFNFKYADLVQKLFLGELSDRTIFDLSRWRELECPHFGSLRFFEFSELIPIRPLTLEEAPNLTKVFIDENFCNEAEIHQGQVDFVDFSKITEICFKGKMGRNEDMLIFGLLTKHPQLIGQITGLHFMVDPTNEHYDRVYRRVVGFFAILRRMGLVLGNLSRLSFPLTNHSTAVIVNLIGKHVYFENLSHLELYIEDDGGVINLVESLQELSSIVRERGSSISHLSVSYRLTKEDVEKNHLRAMSLLRLMEPFMELQTINIRILIEGLDLSNLLMIFGTPLSNNMQTLRSIRIDASTPSENLVASVLPTLGDVNMLFPHLNYLYRCSCKSCKEIMHNLLKFNDFPANSGMMEESIQVSTLMIVGHELDASQGSMQTEPCDFARGEPDWPMRIQGSSKAGGCLFDHLINYQLNESLEGFPRLETFEICGMVYVRDANGRLSLPFQEKFSGLSEEQLTAMVDIRQIFDGAY